MLGLPAELAGLFFVRQFLEKRHQAGPVGLVEVILVAKIKIEAQPFSIKGVRPLWDGLPRQLGVKLEENLGRHVFHSVLELADFRVT